jgi:hypothetical protein
MTRRTLFASSIACATLLACALPAQDNPPQVQPGDNLDLSGLPAERGVYYRVSGQWVALSSTVLMPFTEGRPVALEILNVGSDHTTAEIPGAHSGVQIGNDARPTFYLHGIGPSDVYLVRAVSKADYREVRMAISRHFREWAHYRAEDVAPFEIQGVNGDVVAIKPSADLKPGEYALTSGVQPGDYWLRLGFDFGIVAGAAGR